LALTYQLPPKYEILLFFQRRPRRSPASQSRRPLGRTYRRQCPFIRTQLNCLDYFSRIVQQGVPTTWGAIGLQYSRALRIAPTKVQVSYKDCRLLVIQLDAIVNVKRSYNQLINWIFTTAFNSTISRSASSALSRVTRGRPSALVVVGIDDALCGSAKSWVPQ